MLKRGAFQGHPYHVYLPAGPKRALVVMLHGCTQDPDQLATGTRMNLLAEEHGFAVVYPGQTERGHRYCCWNWYDPANLPVFNQVYREFFSAPYPARTTITQCLTSQLKFEIECIAVVG